MSKYSHYKYTFCEILFSRLHFSSELMRCGHWWLARGKLNATWHFVYKLIEWLHEAWDVHSCFFHVKTSSKEEGMIALRAGIWGVYKRSVSPHQRASKHIYCLNFLKKMDIIWKMRLCFLSKVMLYLFDTHAYRTERPIPKIFSMNTCTITSLQFIDNGKAEFSASFLQPLVLFSFI